MSVPIDGREKREKVGVVILNPYGGIWTDEIFETPEAATAYLKLFWSGLPVNRNEFKLAMGRQTLTVYRPEGDMTIVPWPDSADITQEATK